MRPRRQFLSLMLGTAPLALGLSACTSPDPNYYQIGPLPGVTLAGGPPSVEVRSVSIPGYLDRDGIVKGAQDYKLDIHTNDIWAEALSDMLQSVMVQDLATRLTGSTVIGAGGSIGANADILVEIDVLRFDPNATGQIVLQMQVGLRDGQSMNLLATRTIQHQAPSGGPVVATIVGTMSQLWAEAANDVAAFLVQTWATHPLAVSAGG